MGSILGKTNLRTAAATPVGVLVAEEEFHPYSETTYASMAVNISADRDGRFWFTELLTRARLIVLSLVGVLLTSGLAAASEQSELLYSRGLVEFHAEQYPKALELFDQAVQADADDVYALYYRGVTRARVNDLKGGIADLWAVIRKKPDLSQAELELGVALVEAGSNRDAVGWLESAQHRPEFDGPASLFLGIAQLRLGEIPAAETNLTRAAAADSTVVLASRYYLGVAAYQGQNWKQAQAHFEYVAATNPDSDMGRDAAGFLAKLREGPVVSGYRPYQLYGSVGFQYDSNVAVAPSDEEVKSAEGISNQADGRAVILAGGSVAPWRSEHALFSIGYEFFQSLHFDLTEFNLQDHRPNAQFVVNSGRFQVGILGSYDFYLLSTDSFFQQATALPWVRVEEGEFGRTELFYRMRRRDFLKQPWIGVRDAFNHSPGMRQFFYLGAPERYVWVGYRFDREDPINSQGTSFAYDGNEVSTGIGWAFPGEITADAGYSYRNEQYARPSKGPTRTLPQRHDDIHRVITAIRKQLNDHLSVIGAYYGTFNNSDNPRFEFDRQIGSVSLEVRF